MTSQYDLYTSKMGNLPKITYSVLSNIGSKSFISLNQTATGTKRGFKTIRVNLDTLYAFNKTFFTTTNLLDNVRVNYSTGLKGDGKTATPFGLDFDILDRDYALVDYVNLSQIGNIWIRLLPLRVTRTATGVPNPNNINDGLTLTVTSDIPCFFAGKNILITRGDYQIKFNGSLTPYLYLQYRDGKVEFITTPAMLAESFSNTCIGLIKYSNNTFSLEAESFIRIGNYRLSKTRRGSATPVSAGQPFETNYTLWE